MKTITVLMLVVVLAIWSAGLAVGANAQWQETVETTERLVSDCRQLVSDPNHSDPIKVGRCGGYVQGFLDGLVMDIGLGNKPFVCQPSDGITVNQAVRIFLKYVDEHPRWLRPPTWAGSILTLALMDAFPC